MIVENISWSIYTKECCRPRRGLNLRPPGPQSDGASNWATEAGPVWSESSLYAWRKLGSLATHRAHSEDSDQTGRMPRLIWVFAGRTCHFVGFVMCWLIFYFTNDGYKLHVNCLIISDPNECPFFIYIMMMSWGFMPLSTIFKSYRDVGRVMKGSVQWNAERSWVEFCLDT